LFFFKWEVHFPEAALLYPVEIEPLFRKKQSVNAKIKAYLHYGPPSDPSMSVKFI